MFETGAVIHTTSGVTGTTRETGSGMGPVAGIILARRAQPNRQIPLLEPDRMPHGFRGQDVSLGIPTSVVVDRTDRPAVTNRGCHAS